jgi:hypothetical protein
MAEEMRGVPIGDLPGIESIPDDSLLVVEFLGKAYNMPGAVLKQLFQDILDAMGTSVDDVTEARLTAAIETVLASGKYSGVSPIVEVTKNEEETFVLHVVDAFGIKDYPIKVKVPDLDGSIVMVEINQIQNSTSRPADYSVLLDGEPVTGDELNLLYQSGAVIYGLLNGYMNIYDAEGNRMNLTLRNEAFQYRASKVFGRNFENWPTFKFHAEHRGRNIMIAYVDGKWESKSKPVHPVVDLGINYITGEPLVYVDDEALDKDPEYDPIYLRDYIKNGLKFGDTISCYQRGMEFTMEDGTIIQPPTYTPFSVRFTEEDLIWFYAEQDGYGYTLLADPENGFVATAKKTAPYTTAESKGDDLEVDNGELFLMSAGTRISAGVPISSGGSGVTAPVNGFFTLSVDSDGNLWAHSAENGTTPDFEYDSETGNLYFVTEE